MLWFNLDIFVFKNFDNEFQYILCCGSTGIGIIFPILFLDFNTSYVVVQLTHMVFYNFKFNHFNTSYVVVQRCGIE